ELAVRVAAEQDRAEEAARERDNERALHETERVEREEVEARERERMTAEERARDAAMQELTGKVETQAAQLAALQATADRRRRAGQIAAAVGLPLVAILVVTLSLDFDIVSGAWPVTLLVLAGVALASAGLGMLIGHRRIW